MSTWSDEYISHERVLSVTRPGAAIANVASDRTSPVHSHHSCNECYIGEIVQCATTSQKLFAHHDVAGRSQEENIRSGHASSVGGIHWLVGASMFY